MGRVLSGASCPLWRLAGNVRVCAWVESGVRHLLAWVAFVVVGVLACLVYGVRCVTPGVFVCVCDIVCVVLFCIVSRGLICFLRVLVKISARTFG